MKLLTKKALSLLAMEAALAGTIWAQGGAQPMYPATDRPSQVPNTPADNTPAGMNQGTGQNDVPTSDPQMQQEMNVPRDQEMPVFRVQVNARTTEAVNYRNRGGSTTVGFRGTELDPDLRGEAKVEGKGGRIAINVELKHMCSGEPVRRAVSDLCVVDHYAGRAGGESGRDFAGG